MLKRKMRWKIWGGRHRDGNEHSEQGHLDGSVRTEPLTRVRTEPLTLSRNTRPFWPVGNAAREAALDRFRSRDTHGDSLRSRRRRRNAEQETMNEVDAGRDCATPA